MSKDTETQVDEQLADIANNLEGNADVIKDGLANILCGLKELPEEMVSPRIIGGLSKIGDSATVMGAHVEDVRRMVNASDTEVRA